VQTGLHYPIPLHLQKAYAGLGYKAGAFPVAERIGRECLSLPLFPEMTDEQQDAVVAALRRALD
jgi:dTDP-4-amino-4,6-dideoxygalactose transaminase